MRSTRLTVLSICLPALALCACSGTPYRPDPHTISQTTTHGPIGGRTTLAMPITIHGQPTILTPFAIESEKDWYQTKDPYAAGGVQNSLGLTSSLAEGDFAASASVSRVSWSGGGSVRWHNGIFRDVRSGEEWPILDRRGVISQWALYGKPVRVHGETFKCSALLFFGTIEDTNHDGALNDLDARVAIVAGPDGRRPRVVSPVDAQVWNATYDHENNRLFLLVVRDSNGDGKFDFNDPPAPYMVDLATSEPATPVVSGEMIKRVEGMLR